MSSGQKWSDVVYKNPTDYFLLIKEISQTGYLTSIGFDDDASWQLLG